MLILRINNHDYEDPEAMLANPKYSDKRNQLIYDLYNHYTSLRYVARGNGCNKASFETVYAKLQEPEVTQRVLDLYGYDKEEMNRRLELARKYIPMIK